MTARQLMKRELRVAFSRHAQPVWFRLVKWVVIITLAVRFWRHPQFWSWVLGLLTLSLGLHFFWRWKTRSWTRPWGGWHDVKTANKE
jgi:hypothetical protein